MEPRAPRRRCVRDGDHRSTDPSGEGSSDPRLDAVFADHDLESWEFDVLATLLRNGDPHQMTPGELLDSMMITSGAMTNRIDRLEARGYVGRSKSEIDGRRVLVTLTDDGREKVDAALVDHAANELAIINSLEAEDRRRLVDLLRILHLAVVDQDASR